MVVVVHLFLAITLFVVVNWIGKHSYPVGYTKLSLYPQSDKSLAFNFVLKVFGPVIYLIIVASIFYKFGLEQFVDNIYLVSIYYILIRLFVIVITNKTKFVSWFRHLSFQILLIMISYWAYKELILKKENIIPNLTSIANELWVIIGIFLYQILNKVEFSNESSVRKKERYIRGRYKDLEKKYGSIIKSKLKNQKLEALFFAIMIHEDFNRPKAVRLTEYASFFLLRKKRSHTLGIMQYKTDHYIDDEESVSLALEKVEMDYLRLRSSEGYQYEWSIITGLISEYNGGDSYYGEVQNLYTTLLKFYYKDTEDDLLKDPSDKKTNNLFY